MRAIFLRYPGLALHYMGQFVKTLLEYRASVAIEMFSYLIWIAIDAALIYFVLLPAGHLAGWTLPQVILIFGLHMAALGLFFINGVNLFYIPGTFIIEGQFDRLMVRPLNVLFQVMVERISFEDTITVLTGTLICLWALIELGIPLTIGTLALLALGIASGALVYFGMMAAAASISFLLKDRSGVMQLVLMVGDQIATYPLSIYPSLLRLVFTIGLPLGFVAYYPAHLLFGPGGAGGDMAIRLAWLSPLVGLACAGLGAACFFLGLRAYESAGS